jgi:hypothetical protein
MSRGPGVKECGAAPWRGAGRVRPAGRLLRRQDPTRTRLSWLGAVSSGAGADARSLDAGGPRQ